MKVSVASAQYPVHYHASFVAWKSHTEAWVRQAARQRVQLLLFPEYGSMELMSLLSKGAFTWVRRRGFHADVTQKFHTDFCVISA